MATEAVRVTHPIRGVAAILKSLIAQIRFEDGQLYLDRCGRMLRQLVVESEGEWTGASASPEGTTIANVMSGHRLNFNQEAVSLSLDYSGTSEEITPDALVQFVISAEEIMQWVIDQLEVRQIVRVGFRQRHFFPFDTKEETEQWLMGLGLFNISPSLATAFGGECESVGFRTVLKLHDCWVRLMLGGIERTAEIPAGDAVINIRKSTASKNNKKLLLEAMKQKRARQINPAFFVDYDLDSYLVEPQSYNLKLFFSEHAQSGLERLRSALATGVK